MSQYLTEQETKLWGFSKKISKEQNIKILLGKMAIYRQASRLDQTTLELFTEYLLPLDLRAFQVAMKNLSQSKRVEGETSFPCLGDILAAMDEAREFSPLYSQGATKINDTPVFADPKQKGLQA